MLDCDFTKIEMILQQANEIELLTDYHNYLITSRNPDDIPAFSKALIEMLGETADKAELEAA